MLESCSNHSFFGISDLLLSRVIHRLFFINSATAAILLSCGLVMRRSSTNFLSSRNVTFRTKTFSWFNFSSPQASSAISKVFVADRSTLKFDRNALFFFLECINSSRTRKTRSEIYFYEIYLHTRDQIVIDNPNYSDTWAKIIRTHLRRKWLHRAISKKLNLETYEPRWELRSFSQVPFYYFLLQLNKLFFICVTQLETKPSLLR